MEGRFAGLSRTVRRCVCVCCSEYVCGCVRVCVLLSWI